MVDLVDLNAPKTEDTADDDETESYHCGCKFSCMDCFRNLV